MKLNFSDRFQSEDDLDLNIEVDFSVNEKKISDCDVQKTSEVVISDSYNCLTITIKDFEKILSIYDAFKKAHEVVKIKGV